MKVAFIIDSVFRYGGAQRVTSIIASELAKNNDVYIINTKPVNEDYELYKLSRNVKIFNLSKRNTYHIFLHSICKVLQIVNKNTKILNKFEKLKEYIYYKNDNYLFKEFYDIYCIEKFDYIIGVEIDQAMIPIMLKDKIEKSTKIIAWQHNSSEQYFETFGTFYWNQKDIMKKYLPLFDNYIVLTEHDKEKNKELFNIESVVINNTRTFNSKEKATLNNKIFIAAGRYDKQKGFDLLIKSFKIFSNYDDEWILNIFGEGKERRKLQRLIDKYNLNDRVFLKGFTKNIKQELLVHHL